MSHCNFWSDPCQVSQVALLYGYCSLAFDTIVVMQNDGRETAETMELTLDYLRDFR